MESIHGLFDLTGKTALVTGSSQGIGYEIARGLAQAGAAVILNGRDAVRLEKAVTALQEHGLNVSGALFDVKDTPKMKETVASLPQIDILVNNAGINRRLPLTDFDEASWREVLDINLTSVFLLTQQVAAGMIARGSGKIINIASLTSEVARKRVGAYAASKGAIKILTKMMAVEWAEHNIQANAIGPGYILTELTRPLADDPEFTKWLVNRVPAGRWADPSELVGTAIFLASPASNFITGQVIYVDGGFLASM